MRYTNFHDMYSGGFRKVPYADVCVPLDEVRARRAFETFFDVSSKGSACSCCGPDFSVYGSEFREEGFFLSKKVFLDRCPGEEW